MQNYTWSMIKPIYNNFNTYEQAYKAGLCILIMKFFNLLKNIINAEDVQLYIQDFVTMKVLSQEGIFMNFYEKQNLTVELLKLFQNYPFFVNNFTHKLIILVVDNLGYLERHKIFEEEEKKNALKLKVRKNKKNRLSSSDDDFSV